MRKLELTIEEMRKLGETIEEWLNDNEDRSTVEDLELEVKGKKVIVEAPGNYLDLCQSADATSWDITITVGDETRECDLREATVCVGFSVSIHMPCLAGMIAETIDEMLEEA